MTQLSIGIEDNSSKRTMIVEDDKITIGNTSIGIENNRLVFRGDLKVYGSLDAGSVRTTESISNQRHESQYLEFAGVTQDADGCGILWRGASPRYLLFRKASNSVWSSENIDISHDRSYLINGELALSKDTLGENVKFSNLTQVGTLEELKVNGSVNINNRVFYDHSSDRLVLGSICIEQSTIGTKEGIGLNIITANQSRISISEKGDISLGNFDTVTSVNGKFGIGTAEPTVPLEVNGDVKLHNRLFTVGEKFPTEGNFKKGDIMWNSNPRPGTHIGWVCIMPGTPGVWKPFGVIEN